MKAIGTRLSESWCYSFPNPGVARFPDAFFLPAASLGTLAAPAASAGALQRRELTPGSHGQQVDKLVRQLNDDEAARRDEAEAALDSRGRVSCETGI